MHNKFGKYPTDFGLEGSPQIENAFFRRLLNIVASDYDQYIHPNLKIRRDLCHAR
jgi:hypothetical protein